MSRPGFVVKTTYGVSFDANHLTICWDRGWIISFTCSGVLERIPAEDIGEIRFLVEGPSYCDACGGKLPSRG